MSRSIKSFTALIIAVFMIVSLISCASPNNTVSGSDGIIGGRDPSSDVDHGFWEGGKYYSKTDREDVAGIPEAEIDFYPDGGYIPNGQLIINAGTLTGAEYRDKDNIPEWLKLFNEKEWDGLSKIRKINPTNIIKVTVKNGDKKIFNSKAVLLDENGNELFSAVTDINGQAFLFYNLKDNNDKPSSVKVGDQVQNLNGQKELSFEVNDTGLKVTQLDLMLMVDTTGSMGDELEYLKVELKDMVSRVASYGQNLSIRVSVNFYRDEGDEYIVKYYDFREDIDDAVKIIGEQRSDGGGDYPEAVHTALENAVTGHVWRENAVKICFFVLDAPPHSENEIQEVNSSILGSLKNAAKTGIRIVPVLSSGADTETEFITRTFGIITGGSFVFLTDHSGIGNPHLEPEVPDYEVEYLNECLIRIICDFCGLEYVAPEPKQPETTHQDPTEPSEEVTEPFTEVPTEEHPTEPATEVPTEERPTEPVEVVNDVSLSDFNELFAQYIEGTLTDQKNYMISPISFQYALGMVAAGADGQTLSQLLEAIGVEDIGEFEDYIKDFNEFVDWFNAKKENDLKKYESLPEGEKKYYTLPAGALRVADSVWKYEKAAEFLEDYLLHLEMFDAEHYSFSLSDIIERANEWANEKTEGLIPEILPEDFDASDLIVLLMNALYYKNGWIDEFTDATETDFTNIDGNIVKKEFITSTEYYRYYKDDETELVVVPMKDNVYMTFVIGNADDLSEKIANAEHRRVRVCIPKFEIESSFDNKELIDFLKSLGATDLFKLETADFSRMFDPVEQLVFVSDIIQKTKIKLDETGVEAAAVTAVAMDGGGEMPGQPVEFIADRPFRFFIHTSGVFIYERDKDKDQAAPRFILFEGMLAE